jgi:hypothetical protein
MKYLFDKIWFQDNQKGLLWLANKPIIKIWFRWILRINKDCSLKEKIVEIQPNNYKIDLGLKWTKEEGIKQYYKADFRTKNKFSNRLFYAFYPVWLAFHTWDMLFANRFAPQLNLGFDTLTVYPDAYAETSTTDGWTRRAVSGEAWATIRAGDGTESSNADTDKHVFFIRMTYLNDPNKYDWLGRSIFLFDTSSLPDTAVISAGVMSLYGTTKKDDGTAISPNVDIYTSNPASNTALVASDHQTIGTTSQTGSPITYANWSTSGYNDFTLNATGRGNISKTSITKFGGRNVNYDVDGSTPTWASQSEHYVKCYFADEAGTSTDPKLVVTYTVPATFVSSVIIM